MGLHLSEVLNWNIMMISGEERFYFLFLAAAETPNRARLRRRVQMLLPAEGDRKQTQQRTRPVNPQQTDRL